MSEVSIYLTDLETGNRMKLPVMTDKIKATTGAQFQSYKIMSVGDVKIPNGQDLAAFSWDGKLPGEKRKNAPYITEWQDPKAIQAQWSIYRSKGKKLRLLITGTAINIDVYLENYKITHSGGFGDIDYTINFIQAKDLKVYSRGNTHPVNEPETALTASANAENPATAVVWEPPPAYLAPQSVPEVPLGTARPDPPQSKTYTVKSGDTLWGIAQSTLGKGSRYGEIHAINQPPMSGNAGLVMPGWILQIPSA